MGVVVRRYIDFLILCTINVSPHLPPPGIGWGIFLVWSGRLAPGGRDIESLKCACAIRIVYVCTLIIINTIINFYFALKIIIIMVARAQYSASACHALY